MSSVPTRLRRHHVRFVEIRTKKVDLSLQGISPFGKAEYIQVIKDIVNINKFL